MHCTPEEKGNISLCKYALSTPLERIYIYIYLQCLEDQKEQHIKEFTFDALFNCSVNGSSAANAPLQKQETRTVKSGP
jgi:hypothetical protein